MRYKSYLLYLNGSSFQIPHGKRKANSQVPNADCIPLAHVGARVGCAGVNIGFAGFVYGAWGFMDANMLVSALQNSCIGGIAQHEAPKRVVL